MLSAAEYYSTRYKKVCITHTDYIEFASDYADYCLTYTNLYM